MRLSGDHVTFDASWPITGFWSLTPRKERHLARGHVGGKAETTLKRRPRMAERVCQFFLRGRCQRQKCEFRHPADQAGPRGPIAVAERSGGANKDTLCKFFLSTGCKFGASCHFRHVGRERRRSRFGVCKTQKFSFWFETLLPTTLPQLDKIPPS